MLRKYIALLSADDNTGGGSSNPSDDNGTDSSTVETQQDANEQSEETPEGETEDGDATDSSDDATGADDQQEGQEQGEPEEKGPAPITDKPGDEKLPFHKEPRFQELVKEKNDYKERVAQTEPLAQRAILLDNYLSQNGIATAEFSDALETLRLLKVDPAAAWTKLKPTFEALQMFNGERIPQDLEAQVAAGMSPETAKELARLRISEQRNRGLQQTTQQNQYAQHENMVNGAFSSWDQMKRGVDPDFKPKGAADAPDGKWEFVNAKLIQLRTMTPPRSSQEALALVERAYTEVSKAFQQFRPKAPVTRKPIGSRQSSQNSSPVMKTSEDVARAIMSGKRPHELRYS